MIGRERPGAAGGRSNDERATMLGLMPELIEQIGPSVHTSWQNNGNGIDPLVLIWPLLHLKAGLPEEV